MNSIISYDLDEKDNQISHDTWLMQQVNAAFDRMENGLAVFVSNEEANVQMAEFKRKIHAKNNPL
ncbi:damage-inducible protein J [Marinomonas sp. UCMA 3892]|uniref:RelB protein n=1 Tax=Marinomonas sp. (strain MWYL1) TaxID=400668 RepID=A6VT21_MARMS|nr:hypothetical protein [Marinomonas sp. UCMA 3892]NLU96746.1 damage-inducible protein J [Marinomonas sp. UCMA 3892]